MLCLSLDTTAGWCSVALMERGTLLATEVQVIDRANGLPGHGEVLALMVQNLLGQAQKTPSEINKIIVCTGPGSFTGVRIGLAFAKGFALPHGHEVIGVSALEVWAKDRLRVLSVADVRRGEVFWQVFDKGVAQDEPQLTDIPTAVRAGKNMEVVGSGAHLLGDQFDGDGFVCPEKLAKLGANFSAKTHPGKPLYHRPPDAKLPGGKTL